jgi:hypothetical protein
MGDTVKAKTPVVNPRLLIDFWFWGKYYCAMPKPNGGIAFILRTIKQAQKRRQHALKLRNSGLTVQQVGDRLGVSKQRASELIYRAKREQSALK